jgi:hypothetical protein
MNSSLPDSDCINLFLPGQPHSLAYFGDGALMHCITNNAREAAFVWSGTFRRDKCVA